MKGRKVLRSFESQLDQLHEVSSPGNNLWLLASPLESSSFFFKSRFLKKNSFSFTAKFNRKHCECLYIYSPQHMHRQTSLTGVVPFIKINSPTLTIIITENPYFTVEFTVGNVHSLGSDKYTMTCIHHYSLIWSISTALKIFHLPPVHLSFPPKF